MKYNSHNLIRTKNDQESIHALPFEYDPAPLNETEGYFYTRGMEINDMLLHEWCTEFHRNAVKKGFYRQIDELMENPHLTSEQKDFIQHLWMGHRLMLIVSELGEAMEGMRHGEMSDEPGSGGMKEEIADAFIRLGDFTVDIGMNLELSTNRKHSYNQTRPEMHGKKS